MLSQSFRADSAGGGIEHQVSDTINMESSELSRGAEANARATWDGVPVAEAGQARPLEVFASAARPSSRYSPVGDMAHLDWTVILNGLVVTVIGALIVALIVAVAKLIVRSLRKLVRMRVERYVARLIEKCAPQDRLRLEVTWEAARGTDWMLRFLLDLRAHARARRQLRARARARTERRPRRAAIRAHTHMLRPAEAAFVRVTTATLRHPVRVLLLFLLLVLVVVLVVAACSDNLSAYAATRVVYAIAAATTLGIAGVAAAQASDIASVRAREARALAYS